MASVALVESQIDDGRKLIQILEVKNIDVSAAAWLGTSEEGMRFLYIATAEVDNRGLAAAYRDVYGALREMKEASISPSEIKLVGKSNPIAKDIALLQGERTGNIPSGYRGSLVGGIAVDEVYIYPPYTSLRQSFTVSYTRQADTNNWEARAKQEELFRGISAKGAVGYSTAKWGGELDGSERHGIVAVLMEVGPQFDDPKVLSDPNVRRLMKREATVIADEMFKHIHPEATVEHVDDEAFFEAALRKAQEAAIRPKTTASFIGGPYDGLNLDINQINNFCNLTPISTKRGIRLFVLMPSREEWERLLGGELSKEGPFNALYSYERRFVQTGAQFHYCMGDEISKALADQ